MRMIKKSSSLLGTRGGIYGFSTPLIVVKQTSYLPSSPCSNLNLVSVTGSTCSTSCELRYYAAAPAESVSLSGLRTITSGREGSSQRPKRCERARVRKRGPPRRLRASENLDVRDDFVCPLKANRPVRFPIDLPVFQSTSHTTALAIWRRRSILLGFR